MDNTVNAKWAREVATTKVTTKDSIVLEEIDKRIREAVNDGLMCVYFYAPISTKISEELRMKRGFGVEDLTSQKDGFCYKINW
jgi:hypothetical protein